MNFIVHAESNLKIKSYLIIGFISILFFLYNILKIYPVMVDANDFLGLTAHLTFGYWVGLALLILSCLIVYIDADFKCEPIYVYLLLLVGLYLFGLGVFAEENVRAWSSYYPIAEVRTILESHHIGSANDYPLISYRSWPAIHIISAYIINLTSLDLEKIIKYMPLFWVICFIFVTYAIGKRVTQNINKAFMLTLLAISSFFQVYYYYSPQSFGYLLFIILFFIITTFPNSSESITITVISFLTIIITHLFYCVLVIASSFIPLIQKRKMGVVSLFLISFLFWYFYFAPDAFELGVNKLVLTASDLDLALFSQYEKYGLNNSSESPLKIINMFRFGFIVIYAALLSGSILLYKKMNRNDKNIIQYCLYWIAILPFFGIINYGSESMERIYIFFLLPALCIIILSYTNKKMISIVLILFICLHIPAHYGTESFLMTHTSELIGSDFFASRVDSSLFSTQPPSYYYYFVGGSRYICYYNSTFVNVMTKSISYISNQDYYKLPENLKYILRGTHGNNFLYIYGKIDPIEEILSVKRLDEDISLIYNNLGLKIYNHAT